MSILKNPAIVSGAGAALLCAAAAPALLASSHREAPFISELPRVDGTDFYMFRSTESGREDFVTLIANYQPLQQPNGGLQGYPLDPDALYEIHIDNDGDASEDISFQFRFALENQGLDQDTGLTEDDGDDEDMDPDPIPLGIPFLVDAPVDAGAPTTGLNRIETYQVTIQRDGRRSSPTPEFATNPTPVVEGDNADTTFLKPIDNIGSKTFADYQAYANAHIFDIEVPGCDAGAGRVFVGQRQDSYAANLSGLFDLINYDPLNTARSSQANDYAGNNITSIALELPTACLTADTMDSTMTADPVIGGWTTASLRQARVLNPLAPTFLALEDNAAIEGGPWTQVSRVGTPLVNTLLVGLDSKNTYNNNVPGADVNFLPFFSNPVLPVLINEEYGAAVPGTPRSDLVSLLLTGFRLVTDDMDDDDPDNDVVTFSNQPGAFTNDEQQAAAGEMLRLNTAVPPSAAPDDLGLLACDRAGFPNGRRPGDDVTDIMLTLVEGAFYQGREDTVGTPDVDETRPANPNALQNCSFGENPASDEIVVGEGVASDGVRPNQNFNTAFPYLAAPLPGNQSSN